MKKNSNRNSITQKDYQNTKNIVDQILKDSSKFKISSGTERMIDTMLERYYLHMRNAYIAQMRYRYWGIFTTVLLAILGATVAVILPIIEIPKIVIALIGVLIVLSVMINNTYQFSVNFEKCANFLIQLRDWSTDMEIELHKKINSYPNISESEILSFIKVKDQELSKIGSAFASIIVPPLPPILLKILNSFSTSTERKIGSTEPGM